MKDDVYWMQAALLEAQKAGQAGEVPVGAVLVRDGKLLSTGRNASIKHNDPTAHAEMVALRAAAQVVGNYRLHDATLYVTLEPCAMCAGAILHARIQRLVFAASDPKTGAAGSVLNLFANTQLNHQTQVEHGVLGHACAHELKQFFSARRGNPSPLRQDALRTPESFFSGLVDRPHTDFFTPTSAAFAGLRMAYSCEGPWVNARGWLLLHGMRDWRYVWRHLMPALAHAGDTVLAPDLIGFGESDKPKRISAHHLQNHVDALMEWLHRGSIHEWIVVFDSSAAPLVKALMLRDLKIVRAIEVDRLESASAERFRHVPFPDHGHEAVLNALPGWSSSESFSGSRVSLQLDTAQAAQQAAQYLKTISTPPV